MRANRDNANLGGHISTYASSATLYEVGYNHFFRAPSNGHPGDQIYFQGHASPGIYARAFLEGRLNEHQLENFRREFATRRWPRLLSTPLADAGLLAVPNRVYGLGTNPFDLSGSLQPLTSKTRPQTR